MARTFNENTVSDISTGRRGRGRNEEPTAGFINLIIVAKDGTEVEITGAALVASGSSVKQKRQAAVYEALQNDPEYLAKLNAAGRVKLSFHDWAATQEAGISEDLSL